MGLFDYTQKNYWGGSWYPYWTLMVATVVFGFFGLDHFWLRSPLTGLMKLVANFLTLGFWFFYDIIQVFRDADAVKKYGLSIPIMGPSGIGAGMFREEGDESPTSKSPLRYVFYVILLLLPLTFGLEYVVAGDMAGAGFKFLITLFWFIFLPIVIIYTIMNLLHAVVKPESLFENGTYRLFPVSAFIGPRGVAAAGVLGPHDAPDPDAVCSAGLGAVVKPVSDVVKSLIEKITAPASAAVAAASGAVTAVAKTVETGATVTTTAFDTAGKVIGAVGTAANGLGSIGSTVTSGLTDAAMKKAQNPIQSMKGGGLISTDYTIGDWGLIVSIFGFSAYMAYAKYKEWLKAKEEKGKVESYKGVPVPPASA
jgi:hypothetical protein